MADKHGYPNAESHERLRRSARELIDHGVPPPHRGGTLSVDALQLLYQRASTPESAAEAQKLLHELQTYQVELDLLYEQLQANEYEITEELTHYRSLFELAPAAYLVVATDGEIIEGNQAAGVLFGESAMTLTGKALASLLAPGQKNAVAALLGNSGEQETSIRPARHGSVELPDHRKLAINARSAAAGDSILMILTEATTTSASS
ncbi:PAS domain S-box protein [Marinobacter metalliresistant]|uniref:PAS domain S-box protein n=1 Tax=Marinobacter metalliresistant TaxID=2961995 RepID=A0ABZ2VXT9_9GAMM